MDNEYTPTTEQVRHAADWNRNWIVKGEEFDRWLAAHDAELLSAHRPEPVPVADERVEKITRHVRKISHYEGITAGQGQVLLSAADLIEELARRPVGPWLPIEDGGE